MKKDTILYTGKGIYVLEQAKLIVLLMILTLSTTTAWGEDGYSGTYLIRSESSTKETSSANYYLCPTEGWCYYQASSPFFIGTDNGMPFLTTYQCQDGVYDVRKAVWTIEKAPAPNNAYYYIKQALTGRYLTSNGAITSNADRMRVHLEAVDPENLNGNEKYKVLFTIDFSSNKYYISPKDVSGGAQDRNWLVVNGGNKDALTGQSGKGDGPSGFTNTAGIIGVYTKSDANAPFYLEPATPVTPFPTITNNFDGTITITGTGTIYYTTNDTEPTTSSPDHSSSPVVISLTDDITVIKAMAKDGSSFESLVTTYELPVCEDPVISFDDNTSLVSITCATEGNTIYYTTDGTSPTASDTEYSSSIHVTSATTIKAIAIKPGCISSTVTELAISQVDAPTIAFDQETKKVTVTPTTTGVDYYYLYASGTEVPADPTKATGTPYDSNSGITLSDNSITTIKVIAFENNKIPSDAVIKTIVYMPTITLAGGPYTYDGMPKTPSISSVMVGETPVSGYGSPTYENNTNAGTATVTISEAGINDYLIYGTAEFIINRAPLTATAKNHTITYGDEPANDGVTYTGLVGTDDSSLFDDDLEYAYDGYTHSSDVGTYTITLSGPTTSTNYKITYVNGTLTVAQKEVGLTWGKTDLTYSGVSQMPTVTLTGIVNNDEIGVTVTGAQTDIGSGYIATATGLTGTKAGNYILLAANTTEFSIGKAPLTVTANPHTITYGDAPAANGVKYSGFVNGENESVLTGTPKYYFNYAQYDNVGDNYTITPYDLAATNYAITFVPGTLTVTQKEVGLSWETELTYSGVNQVPAATATGTVNGDEIGVTVTGAQTNIGSDYTATATELTGTKAGNYKLPTANTTKFSIVKASLTVTAKDHTITYGDAPANGGVTYSGFVNNESESVLTGPLGYDYSYARYGDVGDEYTITPKGLTSTNYNITFENGTLTVNPKEVRIKWKNTALTYDGTSKVPTAEITSRDDDIVNDDAVDDIVTVTASAKEGSELTDGVAINPGYYKATAYFTINGAKTGNYKPTPSSLTFSISSKSIGDGNEPAEGIDISLTQVGDDVEVTYVKDGGTTLVLDEDYTVATETQGFDYYIIVTGKGKYGGSARKLFVKPEFFKPTGASEYAAVYRASSDLTNPTGITPYIVKKVNPSMGTINIAPVDYLPKDVPVLMLASTNIQGFLASPKPDDEEAEDYIPVITAETENSNVLKVAPESGVAVEDAQVYMFYKGEFVLTKEGTISEGKFYLYNPNYKANLEEEEEGGGAGARSVLRFVVGGETGIVDVEKSEDSRTASENDAWYLLDGRRLSGKPNKQGLYIWNGRKTVIKKK